MYTIYASVSFGGHPQISDDVMHEGVVTINIRHRYSTGGMDQLPPEPNSYGVQ